MAYTAPPNPRQKSAPALPGGNFTELNIREATGGTPLIRLDDGFVKLLEEQLLAGLAGGAGAAGGFLTGSMEPDALRLTAAQPFASAGLKSLQSVVNERTVAAAPNGAIGMYNLRREPNLALTRDDLALFRERCPQGTRLFLLAGPGDGGIPAAVIYLGQEGILHTERRTVEWPVNLRALGAEEVVTPPPSNKEFPKQPEPARRSGVVKWVAGSAALACVVIAFWSLRPPVRPRPDAPGPVAAPVTVPPRPASQMASALATRGTAPAAFAAAPGNVRQSVPAVAAATAPPAAVFTPPVRSTAAPSIELQYVPESALSAPSGKMPEIGVVVPPPPPIRAAAPPVETRPAMPQISETPAVASNTPAQASRLTPPRPLLQVTPAVSPAIMRGVQGFTIVSVRVDVNGAGKVTSAETVSKGAGVHNLLALAVVDAVKRWQFEPARDNGRPVPGTAVLHFKYINQ